jgi:hypothetical protein
MTEMTRRSVIKTAAAVAAGSYAVSHHTETVSAEEEIERSQYELFEAGTLGGTGGPVGIDGSYPSKLYWASEDWFDGPFTIAAATVGPSEMEFGDAGRIFFNADNFYVSNYVLYHERGHNLGFRHDDSGIMSYGAPDSKFKGLHETTITIKEHSDGLHTLDWSKGTETLERAISLWKNGYITSSDLRYCVNQWQSDASHKDLYSPAHIKKVLKNADRVNHASTGSANIYTDGLYRAENTGESGSGWS